MDVPFGAYVILDALALALTLAVAAFFGAAWRRSGDPLHLLFAAGFAILALGFAAVSTSQFDLARAPEAWDGLRFAAQTAGALVLVFAYLSARRHGAARPLRVLGWLAAAGGVLLAALYWVVPPEGRLPSLERASATAHAVQFVAFAACVVLSMEAYRRGPSADRALVPAAFLAWGFSKYTWLLIDLTGAVGVVPLVFVWRFAAIALLLLALVLPVRAAWRGAAAAA